MTHIHLLCDRCRAEGQSGDDPFAAYAHLLDFTPVPRRKKRADGWDAECQRAFIAALAATGSARQAAHAVGKAQFGVENLKNAPGNGSFMAAFHRALAFHAENRSLRLADGVRTASALAAHRQANAPKPAWSHAATRRDAFPPTAPEQTPEDDIAERKRMLETLVHKYLLKLGGERQAREEGRIAAADFYLRQLTHIEILLDIASADGMKLFRELRRGGLEALYIAQTPFSKVLDHARRAHWEACGDPPRPAPPPPDTLREREDGSVTQPLLQTWGGLPESHEEQRARYESTFERDAQAHVEWEAEARRDFEVRRAASQPHGRLDGQSRPAGREASPSESKTTEGHLTGFTPVTAPQPIPAPEEEQEPRDDQG